MPQFYRPMTEAQFKTLMHRVNEGCMSDEEVYLCNVAETDHLHVRRLGDIKGGDEARVGVMTHSAGGITTIFLSAGDARSLAETLLSLAEEVDGQEFDYTAVPDDLTGLPEPDEDDTTE